MVRRVVSISVFFLLMIVSALPVAAQTDQFQIAYGDTVSDGVPGPGAGNIEAVGAQDIYEFDATAGDDAIFDSVVGNNGVFGWRLVAPDGTVLVDSFNVDRRLTLPVTGTYTFTVRGFQANTTGVYSFRLLLVPPPQMFAINIGDTISNGVPSSGAGNLEVPGAVDIYTFDGAAGGGIIFDALIGNTGLARVILTAPDGTQLFSGFYLDQQATFSQSGTYTLRVEGLNITSTGIYSFQLLNIAVPQIFTISIGEIVSDGVPATGAGNLEVPGAIDIYSFDGVANQVMIFDALAGNTGVFRVILTAPDGSEIVDDFYLDRQVTLPQTGTYNLQISGSLVTNFGVYSFQLINVPPGAEEFTINIGDTVSDGVPAAGAGNLEVPGAVDVYNFDGVTGQETIFDALVGDTGQFRIVLTAPDGTELFDDFYQDQQVTLPQTGIYNLRITGGQITIYGTYSFQLLLVPPSAQEFAISIGDTISDGVPAAGAGNLEVPGAVDIYRFDGAAGQNVILDALVGNSGQFRILLTAPDGTTLFDTFYIDQQVSLSQTGSYSLTVYGGSVTNFGVYSFALVDVPNSNPVATDDTATTDEDVAATIDVLSNDTDVDGDTLSITSVTQPVNGVVANNGTDVTYTPDANFNGTDSFNYIVSDGNGGSDTATVTVTVNPVNDDPAATDDTAVTNEDMSVLVDVLANDTDIDGDSLSIASVTQPANGLLVNNGMDVTYTPNPNFNGTDTLNYTVSDGNGGTSTATVNITINPVNDNPVANDDTAAADEDVSISINVLSNDTDVDGDQLVVENVTQPANGTVTNNGADVTYTPNANFNGTDTFTYTVSDGNGGVDTAMVSVTINPVNDSPTLDIRTDPVEVNEGDTVTRAFTTADVDGDLLTVQSSTGTATALGGGSFEWSYLADDGPTMITVTVTVSDGQGGTASASFDLTVVNVPPTADFANTSGTITAPGSATLSFSGQTDPSQADTNAGFLYSYDCTTAGTFIVSQSTSASFNCLYDTPGVYTARGRIEDKDGGFTDLFADVIVEAPANNAPDAQDDLATTDEDTPVTINVLSNDTDADGDPLAIESVTQPTNGIVTDNGADVTYTPNANFNGTDIFTYTVRDGNGGVDMAAVLVTVNPVNDLPVSNDDSAVTDEGIAVTINVLANDSDVDGDSLIVSGVTQAINGTVTNNGNSVTYSPNGGFTGIDTFAYTTSDAVGGSSTATVTVTVNPVGTPGDITLTLQVSQSSDDVNEDSRFFVANSPLLWIRNSYWGHRDLLGLRFNGVSIPQGATIDEAYVEIYTPFRGWVNIYVEYRADAAGNSPTFDRFNRPSQRTLTTARAEHHGDADWRSRSWNRFNDIAPVIQEVVGRGDWQSGNSLSLIVRGTGQRLGGVLFASYDLYPAFAPRLVISYHLSPIASIQEQVVPQVIEPIAAPTTTPEPPKSTPAIEPPVEVLPTETATIEPTLVPTATPEPTDVPTVEILPTETPTVEPTLAPTPTPEPRQPPTVEVVPTEAPTVEPTLSPTPTPDSTQESAMPPLPTLTITADAMIGVAPMAVQFASAATDATDYAWDFGDGVGVSAEANPIYTFTTPGTYIVTLAVSRPGGSASASLTITVTG